MDGGGEDGPRPDVVQVVHDALGLLGGDHGADGDPALVVQRGDRRGLQSGGDLDGALTRARRAQAWDPALSLYDLQEAYALGLLANERPSEYLQPAIDVHNRALEREPTFDLGWANLAALHAQDGNLAAAQEAMRHAAAINPQVAAYWWWLGEGERALAADPDLAEYVRDRDPAGLRAFLDDDERSAGLRLYVALLASQPDEAARLVPTAQQEGGWMAHLALGMHAEHVLRDSSLAMTWLNRAVSARPQDERPALARAALALASDQVDAAEADARRALFADRYGGAYGWALLAQVDYVFYGPLEREADQMRKDLAFADNAAKALEPVMPQMGSIGFMADSLRIPTNTASLIVLNATFQTEMDAGGRPKITQDVINKIYEEAAAGPAKNLLKVSYEQNVSSDMIGENAATVIEALETHTRTGLIPVKLPGTAETVEIPVTHAKIFGWYDNELGSYTHRMGELTAYIAEQF